MWFISVSLAVALAHPGSQLEQPIESSIIDEDGFVRQFYGVPIDLNVEDVHELSFDYLRGYTADDEGEQSPAAAALVADNVLLSITFSEDGDLYMLETSSDHAVGPGGVGVGSSYADVKAQFPNGRLSYGVAHGAYVVFVAGPNLYFDFDPADMPAGSFDLPEVPPIDMVPGDDGKLVPVQRPGWKPKPKVEPDLSQLRVNTIRMSRPREE